MAIQTTIDSSVTIIKINDHYLMLYLADIAYLLGQECGGRIFLSDSTDKSLILGICRKSNPDYFIGPILDDRLKEKILKP